MLLYHPLKRGVSRLCAISALFNLSNTRRLQPTNRGNMSSIQIKRKLRNRCPSHKTPSVSIDSIIANLRTKKSAFKRMSVQATEMRAILSPYSGVRLVGKEFLKLLGISYTDLPHVVVQSRDQSAILRTRAPISSRHSLLATKLKYVETGSCHRRRTRMPRVSDGPTKSGRERRTDRW
jgi:hypothetical protein